MAVYDWFLKTLLVTEESIPVQSLWGVMIDPPPSDIFDVDRFETNWDVSKGKKLDIQKYSYSNGALIFAQGVKIPGEGLNVTRTGPENTGSLRGLIGQGRSDLENLSISFIETNTSFTDYVLRPWAVQVSHRSLKATDLKKNITVTHYKKIPGKPFTSNPRRIIKFINACPVNINTEDYDYQSDKITIRQVEFAYERYELL